MNKRLLKFGTVVMALAISFSTILPVHAESKQEAQNRLNQLQQEQADLQERLNDLKASKASTEAYIEELDAEQQTVVSELQEVQKRLDELEVEIAETEANLAQARQDADDQYAALKVRIRQMYEQGDTSLMEIVMQADDISTILNSSEYIAKISEYDEALLSQLNETVAKIEKYEKELEEQKAEEEREKAEKEAKKAELDTILEQKKAELASLGISIDDVSGEIHSHASEIDDTKQLIAAIEAAEKKAAEEAKRRAEEAKKAAEEAKKQQQQQQGNGGQTSANKPSTGGQTPSGGSSSSGSAGAVTGNFMWPCGSRTITSGFGGRTSPGGIGSTNHQGIDIGAGAGSAIYAADGGVVAQSGWNVARGNYVVISHGNGLSTLYQHCSAVYVSAGQSVSKGSTIAAVGSTGYSTGPHLHFEVWVNGVPNNPLNYVG